MKRAAAVLALSLAALLGGAGTALAHNTLISSDPPEGAQLPTGPKQVRLTFDQPVRPGYDTITVTGPGGTQWTGGAAQVTGNTVTAPVRELGPPGEYAAGYRILSNDGHPVTGKVTFHLAQPGNGTPAPAAPANGQPAEQDSGAMPVWPWIVGAVILLGLGLALALRLGKSAEK